MALIDYYKKIVDTDVRIKELKKSNKKVIGLFCNFIPLEIIYALDCIPVRLGAGNYNSISKGEEIYPRDTCPLVKSSLGLFKSSDSFYEYCDLIILPTPCDVKIKTYDILNSKIPTILLEIPMENDLEYLNLFIKEMKSLIRKLEKFTHRKLKRKNLLQAINMVRDTQQTFRELHSLKKSIPSPLTGKDYMIIYQASFYDDIIRWNKKTKNIIKEINIHRFQNSFNKKRILLAGAPLIWPNFKLLNIIQELGAQVVVDELCSATRWLYDLVEIDEYSFKGIIEAISARYLIPSTCPCFLNSDDRIDRIRAFYNEFNCDGIIYHTLRLCQLHDIESVKIKNVFKSEDLPFLQIHTDYSKEDIEQIKTRVEAFLEILK